MRSDTSRHAQAERGFDSRSLPANQLVGRLDELRCIERILDDLDRGRPGAIELVLCQAILDLNSRSRIRLD